MKRIIATILLLGMCLSIWGCSSNVTDANSTNKSNRPGSATSNQRPNNSNNSGNSNNVSPSTKIDPNGFSSLEQLVEALLAFEYTGTATKTQVRKIFPEKYFEKNYGSFEAAYSKYLTKASTTQKSLEPYYGTDYTFSYSIIAHEIRVDMSKENISTSEDQEHIELYGVSLKERCQYTVKVSLTIKGNKAEKTKQIEINCAKVGNKWYGW